MARYECFKCGEEVKIEEEGIRCPNCGSKILKKKPREEVKRVKAR